MAARNRMPPWHEKLTLANGRELLIRPVRPEDAGPIRAGFSLLEPNEIRQRFLHPMKELGESQADRLTRPDPRSSADTGTGGASRHDAVADTSSGSGCARWA